MRNLKCLMTVLTITLALGGCGDDNGNMTGTTSTVTTTTVGPSRAEIDLEITGAGFVATGMGNATAFNFTLTESAGLGANINFIRVDLFTANGEFLERQEFGAGQVTSGTGSNRLNANESRDIEALFFFRATVKTGRLITLTVGLTDDRGNVLDQDVTFVFQ